MSTQDKQPVGVVGDISEGTWYRSACSGLWYRNPMAAGSFNAINRDGRLLVVGAGGCVELEDASEARKTGFDCSALLDLLAGWRLVAEACQETADNKRDFGQLEISRVYDAKAESWRKAIAQLEAVVGGPASKSSGRLQRSAERDFQKHD